MSADAQHLQLDGVRDIQAHKSSDGFACLARTNEKTDDLQKGDRGGGIVVEEGSRIRKHATKVVSTAAWLLCKMESSGGHERPVYP